MAEVLTVPREPDYYASPSLKRSSTSYASFLTDPSTYASLNTSSLTSDAFTRQQPTPSAPSATPDHALRALPSSSPDTAHRPYHDRSFVPPSLPLSISSSSPSLSSTSSLDTNDDVNFDNELSFPSYDDGGVQFIHQDEPLGLLSPCIEPESDTSSPKGESIIDSTPSATTDSTVSESPIWTPCAADDTAVHPNPSRHVDYLSHDWCEEDLWSSWRHVISRRAVYGQKSRLENASWRTWSKSKYNLATISPESLNWLKESDVTWLYGPLQSATSHPVSGRSSTTSPTVQTPSTAPPAKKPILKRRTMSEVMLEKSLSASSLVKQAAACVQAQQYGTAMSGQSPLYGRSSSGFNRTGAVSRPVSRDQFDYFSPRTTTSNQSETPSDDSGRRHIRFDHKVEQCIAVDCKTACCESEDDSKAGEDDSESEGEIVMIKTRHIQRPPRQPDEPAESVGKIIQKLPDTTLKCKDSPEPKAADQPFLSLGRSWCTTKLFQSPSQETIRPENPSKNFLLAEEDAVDDSDDIDFSPSGAFSNRRDSVAVTRARISCNWGGKADDAAESSGLRRTPSGMFMPYEEDEDDAVAEHLGLLGKVSDTINTAKDIAHVIWNVGWRK